MRPSGKPAARFGDPLRPVRRSSAERSIKAGIADAVDVARRISLTGASSSVSLDQSDVCLAGPIPGARGTSFALEGVK
jgi:hypothetical protein